MTPNKNLVLAEILHTEEKTTSGLILPTDHKNKYRAKVLFAGLKTEYVKVGDTVAYHQGSGVSYTHEGKDCLFLIEDVDIDFIV
jgi:co-chaperonin GroES (HSP10)